MLDNYAKSSLKRYKCKVKQMIFHVAKYKDYKRESRDPVHVAHKLLIQSAENMRLKSYNSMWQRHAERGTIEINKRRTDKTQENSECKRTDYGKQSRLLFVQNDFAFSLNICKHFLLCRHNIKL